MTSRMLAKALRGCVPVRTAVQPRRAMSTAAASQAATKGAAETQPATKGAAEVPQQQQQQQQQRGVGRWGGRPRDSFTSPLMPGGLFDLWSPLSSSRSMRQMIDNMNRLMDVDFMPSLDQGLRGGMRTPWDILEKEDAYYLRIDMPGFERSDLKIHVEDDEMVIQAEKKAEEDVFGTQRSVNTRMLLPQEAVKDKIKAELKNGVLTITVLKEQVPEEKKHVQVQIE